MYVINSYPSSGHPDSRSKGLDSKPMIDFQPIDLTYQGTGINIAYNNDNNLRTLVEMDF